MAPRKRKEAETPKETAAAPASPRRTRSSSARVPAPAPAAAAPVHKRPSKKSKPSKAEDGPKESSKPAAAADVADAVGSKTIIVEACKQCTQFKKRALLVKEGLENGVPGVSVKINPEKPRRGCFEIREENGKTFVSLLAMPRPFEKMRALDMDKVIADIIKNIA
ncbi:uncharacterized protein LOC131217177 [Magnolia sinica]|uniref:uncharacterized protein LOC131217177 n=1 Tax=Magnolia sinica TaxID=86752 RepID=UPI002659AFFE|nr:uncharacterized protein LOC131217177 [Magnolia sinica]